MLYMRSYRQTQIDSTSIDSENEFYKTFNIFWKTTLDWIHYFFLLPFSSIMNGEASHIFPFIVQTPLLK